MRDRLCRCFVLHRRDFGNTSLLIEVFSAEEGRLPVLAKGAKRGRRSTAADLQPFRPLWLGWVGRGEVKTLIRTEPAGCPIGLPGTALFCGFYLNELLMRLVGRHDPHEGLFAFYHAALTELAQGAHLDSALRRFELRLLREVGYAIILDRDAFSGEVRETRVADIALGARVAVVLPNIDWVMPMGSSQDVPALAADVHEFQAVVTNTT
ncbi:MAG: DNA repair protein RecO, partial [Chromatiaceae bacterium]